MHLDIHLQRAVHYITSKEQFDGEVWVPEDVCPAVLVPEVRSQLVSLGIAHHEGEPENGSFTLISRARGKAEKIARQYREEEIAWRILEGVSKQPDWGTTHQHVEGIIIDGHEVADREIDNVVSGLISRGLIKGVQSNNSRVVGRPELTQRGWDFVKNDLTPMDYLISGEATDMRSGTNYNVNFSGSNVSGASFGDGNTIHASQDNRTQSVNFGESVKELRQLIAEADLDEMSRVRLEDRVDDIEDSAEDEGLLEKSLSRFIDFVSTKLADKAAEGTIAALIAGAQAIAMTQGIAL